MAVHSTFYKTILKTFLQTFKKALKPHIYLGAQTLCMTFLEKGTGLYFGRVSTFQQPGAERGRVTGSQW